MAGLDLDFEVRVLADIDESFPSDLPVGEVAEYISRKKADAYRSMIHDDELVITADTVVVVDQEILGKPEDADDARRMLRLISGREHQVITGVCLTTTEKIRSFSVSTDVVFKQLSESEIDYFIWVSFEQARQMCSYENDLRVIDKAERYLGGMPVA